MFSRIARARVALVPAAIVALLAPATQAVAADTDTGSKTAYGGCVKPAGSSIWSPSGAYAKAIAEDSVIWESARHLHIYYGNGFGELRGCQSGYLEAGGSKKLSMTTTVDGTAVDSCSIGWQTFNCTVTYTQAKATYDTGWTSNGTGKVTVKGGGGDVWATGSNGTLFTYTHAVTADYRYSGDHTLATATVKFNNGD